jgi:hypothetical protein
VSERKPPISIHLPNVRAKDRQRDQLQAHLDAFLRKRGNKIQVLDSHLLGKPLQVDYRELNTAMAKARMKSSDRRRSPKGEEE